MLVLPRRNLQPVEARLPADLDAVSSELAYGSIGLGVLFALVFQRGGYPWLP